MASLTHLEWQRCEDNVTESYKLDAEMSSAVGTYVLRKDKIDLKNHWAHVMRYFGPMICDHVALECVKTPI